MIRVFDLIKKKRDNKILTKEEITSLIKLYLENEIPEYQMSAFLMAVFFNGFNTEELATFTKEMQNSGKSMDFSYLNTAVIDKHSTGGVGDKTSLPLIAAVASLGIPIPMIAGRGLGHTGGTIDKLESIPGFNVDISILDFQKQVDDIGCALIGQTSEIAPADKRIYALRDVTATVECIPLIASSILSKKFAEGISGLVLDVKFGSGAFMKDIHKAKKLATTMCELGKSMGKHVVARLTSMQQPLGKMIGNSLEVIESIDVLQNNGPKDLTDLVVELGAEMLLLAKKQDTLEDARQQISKTLQNGSALEKFTEIIKAQGGDTSVIENPQKLPVATKKIDFCAKTSGFINSMDTEAIGVAALLLGGGRLKAGNPIDVSVGIKMQSRLGQYVENGQPLCTLFVNKKEEHDAIKRLENAFVIGIDRKKDSYSLFEDRINI